MRRGSGETRVDKDVDHPFSGETAGGARVASAYPGVTVDRLNVAVTEFVI